MAEQIFNADQAAWQHDPGYWGGYFHTYDSFRGDTLFSTARKLHIFLPRSYNTSQERYPVLYMNDGDTLFFPGGAYGKSWKLASLVSKLYLREQIRKIIVVGICTSDRDYEYTHAPVWQKKWGGLDDYSTYLVTYLKPFIDNHYRTNPQASVIGGAGHGGLAAFYTAAKYPNQFSEVAALSPSFWVGLDSGFELSLDHFSGPYVGNLRNSALLYTAERTLKEQRLKIYLDWGLIREGGHHNAFFEERATARAREMRDLLIHEFGYKDHQNLFTVEDPIGQHSEESWSGRMDYVLKLFFGI